jgi:DNA replication and repair protein RecF
VALSRIMRLNHLSLTNFRNFARLDVDVPSGPVLLVGGNAQGKTSLLEAVYFLATMVSFHASADRELINLLAIREPLAVARIVADFTRQEELPGPGSQRLAPRPASTHRMEVRLIAENGGFNGSSRTRKEVLLDGVKVKLSEAVGAFNAVLFLPQMLRIVEGSPEERRRYLNLTLAQVLPRYATVLSHYSRTLTQRNALLKQLAERGGDESELAYWDERLAVYGSQLVHARIQSIRELEQLAARMHSHLTRGKEVLRLDYQPAFDPLSRRANQYTLPLEAPVDRSGLSLEKIQQGFLECLQKLHREEIARGVTTVGPHRDELRFLGNGIDLGTYGSRGQARSAMLSMKLAEVDWMKAKSGQWPVLLLDEVLAELDTDRRDDLLARLLTSDQALLTTTDLDLFSEEFSNRSSIWYIRAGRLEEANRES